MGENQHPTTVTSSSDGNQIISQQQQHPTVGSRVCIRYNDNRWYERKVVTIESSPQTDDPRSTNNNDELKNKALYTVRFTSQQNGENNDEEEEEDEVFGYDEIRVGMLAYDIIIHRRGSIQNHTRLPVGTRTKKYFADQGWFHGAVIAQTPLKSLVLYREDDEEEYLSDTELQVTAAIYNTIV